MQRIFLLIVASFALILVGCIPAFILSFVPQSTFVLPEITQYQPKITTTGVLEQPIQKEVYIEAPVIAQEVYVSVGDYVKEGEVVANINTELTQSVLSQGINVLTNLPTVDEASVAALSQIAQSYGISEDALNELLENPSMVYGVSKMQEVYVPNQILAPMDGVVTEISLKSDVLTQTAKPVMKIADEGSFRVKAAISETQIGEIETGDKVSLSGAALRGRQYEGVVSKIYPTAKRQTTAAGQQATVDIEIQVTNPDKLLKDGYSTSAEIYTGDAKQVLAIPYEIIRQDENQVEYVYVWEDGKAVRRNIVTGSEMSNCVEVVSGVDERSVVLCDVEVITENGYVWLKEKGNAN